MAEAPVGADREHLEAAVQVAANRRDAPDVDPKGRPVRPADARGRLPHLSEGALRVHGEDSK